MQIVRKSKRHRARPADDAVRARLRLARGIVLRALFSVFCFSVFAPSAFAGPPSHPRTPSLDVSGFNHACGVAVDSEGDVYVASAGEDKIRVFDPAHVELTSIPNTNEPCGLAVDSDGKLYVSEKGTGRVVRYLPNVYPFSGTPIYSGPAVIDASGETRGISVDPFDNWLYVAKGGRIDAYDASGTLGSNNELQSIQLFGSVTGGTFTLSFAGETTGPLAYNASHGNVQAALEGLPAIGAGNVTVSEGSGPQHHIVEFVGKLAHTNVGPISADPSGLEGVKNVEISNLEDGFNGHIGVGNLTNATGVAAYTYPSFSSASRYVIAADSATNRVDIFRGSKIQSLKLIREIQGPESGKNFGFGAADTYLAVDSGNAKTVSNKCAPVAEQACTAGHFLVYDAASNSVNEFDATGEFLDRITDPELVDAKPTGLAADRSGGAGEGTIYLNSGVGAGAELLAFGPLPPPSRPALDTLSHVLPTARAVGVDSAGDVYVAAGGLVHVYASNGKEIPVGPAGKGIEISEPPASDLVVDSTGKVYVLVNRNSGNTAAEKVQYYTPSAFPPASGTQYSGPTTVANGNSFVSPGSAVTSIGINPANDHIFFSNNAQIVELKAASDGSGLFNPCFGCEAGLGGAADISVYSDGFAEDVYIAKPGAQGISIVNQAGTEVLTRVSGAGSPNGPFSQSMSIAVDQSNGHLLAFNPSRGVAEEYDGSGAFVSEFGKFTTVTGGFAIAIDNSGGAGDGNVYAAFDDGNEPFDLTAFGPLSYGEPPRAVTGVASGIGGGNATLNGTVDPGGVELEECHFEYLGEGAYKANLAAEDPPFEGAQEAPCVPGPVEIGKGTGPITVHAEISGVAPETRYRFRLVSTNKYGRGEGNPWLFGPPLVTPKEASPVLYDEATLRAEVDTSGLVTEYSFQYGLDETYGQSTSSTQLPAGDGPVAITVPLVGLAEGTEYHVRIVVKNGASTVQGSDQTLVTLKRPASPPCPNTEFRTGLSAKLPDCRAYELVTPADTRGRVPGATIAGSTGQEFNNWLVAPRGGEAGESVAYFIDTLPGFEGSGGTDGYRALRGAGSHPASGWATSLFGPSFAQIGLDGTGSQEGVAADQLHWLYEISGASEAFDETLPTGQYLRTPGDVAASPCNPKLTQGDFELVGCGSLGIDPQAESRYVSPGGSHVIFFSKAHLEPNAAPVGTTAIYDRPDGHASAQVVSVKPGGSPFAGGENASYLAASEDGSAAVFEVDGTLYLYRAGTTSEIAPPSATFAGISEDGTRVFFAAGASGSQPAALFACDVEVGPCVGGPAPPGLTEIAPASIFINVSPDGSRVFFTSEEALTGSEENEADETAQVGEHNLYAWDGVGTSFVAILDPQDFVSFDGNAFVNLRAWTSSITAGVGIGRNNSPTRVTPGGEVFLFQSHARLTDYDNEGHGEIYRYDPASQPGQRLVCISCDPSRAPPTADAQFLFNSGGSGVIKASTLVTNVTDDGNITFFQSADPLLPEDANDAQDVYEWAAQGVAGCTRPGGCLALISSGQGETASFLYGMSANGDDVFFETLEKLVGQDIPGSPSLYDARVGGGIPNPPVAAPCQGDACQGQGSAPPVLPSPTSSGSGGDAKKAKPLHCPKGKRKVKRGGKAVCTKRTRKSQHKKRAAHNGRPGR
jgi:hypothetical protein